MMQSIQYVQRGVVRTLVLDVGGGLPLAGHFGTTINALVVLVLGRSPYSSAVHFGKLYPSTTVAPNSIRIQYLYPLHDIPTTAMKSYHN